jgi:hypothetical protein
MSEPRALSDPERAARMWVMLISACAQRAWRGGQHDELLHTIEQVHADCGIAPLSDHLSQRLIAAMPAENDPEQRYVLRAYLAATALLVDAYGRQQLARALGAWSAADERRRHARVIQACRRLYRKLYAAAALRAGLR